MIVIEPTFAGVAYPLDYPRIGGRPYSGTVAASTAAAGFPATNAANTNTADWWRPTAVPATWQLTHASGPVSYFGIAAHNIGTVGGTVEFQRWNGSAWVTILTHTPTDDSAIFGLLRRVVTDRTRLRFTGAIPTVGVIYFGDVTEFPQRADYAGSVSFDRAVRDEYSTPVSDGGQWVGRYVTRRSVPARMKVDYLSEAWAAAYLTGVLDDLKARPAFMADRPGTYPASVVYGYTLGPVVPERINSNKRASISVTFDVVGNA